MDYQNFCYKQITLLTVSVDMFNLCYPTYSVPIDYLEKSKYSMAIQQIDSVTE